MPTHEIIATPTEGPGGIDAPRSAHFGKAESFTIIDVTDGVIVGSRAIINPPHEHGGCGMTVALLAREGVTSAIVVGMGPGPIAAMGANGITPLFDDESPTARQAAEAFAAGRRVAFGPDHSCKGH